MAGRSRAQLTSVDIFAAIGRRTGRSARGAAFATKARKCREKPGRAGLKSPEMPGSKRRKSPGMPVNARKCRCVFAAAAGRAGDVYFCAKGDADVYEC
jgi:hypothetical protein